MQETSKTLLQDYESVAAFSDDEDTFAEANKFNGFEGNKVRIHELESKQIIFLEYVVFPSKYHKDQLCLKAQIVVDGEKRVLFTGSKRIAKTLELFKDKLPRAGKIVRENNGWKIA